MLTIKVNNRKVEIDPKGVDEIQAGCRIIQDSNGNGRWKPAIVIGIEHNKKHGKLLWTIEKGKYVCWGGKIAPKIKMVLEENIRSPNCKIIKDILEAFSAYVYKKGVKNVLLTAKAIRWSVT